MGAERPPGLEDRQRCTTTESDKGGQKISELQRDGTGEEIAKPRDYREPMFKHSLENPF